MQPIQSDPDVAGIGVLVAFSATAVFTFIAIVVGYLTDSLPDSTLTELDRACQYSTFGSSPDLQLSGTRVVPHLIRKNH